MDCFGSFLASKGPADETFLIHEFRKNELENRLDRKNTKEENYGGGKCIYCKKNKTLNEEHGLMDENR